MRPVLDIDRITAPAEPVFADVSFRTRPAALRQLLLLREIVANFDQTRTTMGLDIGSKQADLTRMLGSFGLRCVRLDIEGRDDPEGFMLADGERMPFRDGAFDYLVMAHVEHVDRLLSECRRILKPGGKVFILQANRYGWWKFWRYYLRRKYRKYHWRTFDILDIRHQLASHGIQIRKMFGPYHF